MMSALPLMVEHRASVTGRQDCYVGRWVCPVPGEVSLWPETNLIDDGVAIRLMRRSPI